MDELQEVQPEALHRQWEYLLLYQRLFQNQLPDLPAHAKQRSFVH